MSKTNSNANADSNNKFESITAEKKKLIDTMSKEELVNTILEQNNLLIKQSNQMIDIVDMANNIEMHTRSDESKKCDIKKINHDILNLQKQQIDIYEKSFKTQLVLFILFIVILIWLLYHQIVQ